VNCQSRRWFRSGALLSVTLLLTAALWLPAASTATAATPTTFSGQATALKGSLLGLGPLVTLECNDAAAAKNSTICLAATQSRSGATEIEDEASVLCYPAEPSKSANCAVTAQDLTAGLLVLDVLHASVVSQGNKSNADSYVAQFEFKVPGVVTISATALRATAEAKCTNGTPSVSGGESTTVTINDATFAVSGSETQTIPLPGGLGYIVLNEGASSGRAGNDITVTALHVVISPPGTPGINLYVAQAHADITCATNGCAGKNAFVTSGGFIIDRNGNKAHFAVAGRNLTAWGHVLYGPTKLHVKDPMANVYDTRLGLQGDPDYSKFSANVPAPMTDTFQGAAILTWKDGSGAVLGQVLVIDMGEPGRSDFFEILTTDGSANAWGTLAGGNIQMHGKC